MSGHNSKHLADLHGFDCLDCGGYERQQVLEGVACAAEYDDSQLSIPRGQVRNGANCLGSCSSSRTRTRGCRFVSRFQARNGLLPRHGWKRIEEFVEAVVAFEIVDQIPEGTRVPANTGVPPRISGSL